MSILSACHALPKYIDVKELVLTNWGCYRRQKGFQWANGPNSLNRYADLPFTTWVFDASGTEFWEGGTDRGSEAGLDSVSGSGGHRKGLFVVVRLSEVGLIGEKGTKVPNASIAEISVEVELCLTFNFEYTR